MPLLLLLCGVLPRLLLSLQEAELHVQALTGRVDDQRSPAWSKGTTSAVLWDGQVAGIEPLSLPLLLRLPGAVAMRLGLQTLV